MAQAAAPGHRTRASGTGITQRPELSRTIDDVMSGIGPLWAGGPMVVPSLAQLAGFAGVSPTDVSRTFTRELGHPPIETLRLLRLHWAATLLRQTPQPIRSISADCGFANEFHFSLAFKRWAGCSPTEFRRGDRREPPLPGSVRPLARFLERQAVESEFPPSPK